MYDDVCPMLYRTDKVRRAERIVYDERNPVAVCDVGHGINVYDVAIGVSQCLDEYGFGVFLYGLFEIAGVFRIDECSGDAVCRQGVGQEVVAAAVNGFGGYDVVACMCDVLESVSDGGRSRSYGQSGYSAFQGGHAFLEHSLRAVGQPSVDVAGGLQAEACGCIVRIVEHV